MRVGSLRDDVFLLAHDDAGRLVGSEAGVGAGLAGATLIELLLAGRVAVADGRLDVIDSAADRGRGVGRDAGGDRRQHRTVRPAGLGQLDLPRRLRPGRRAARRGRRGPPQHRPAARPAAGPALPAGPGRGPDPGPGPGPLRDPRHRELPDPATAALCGLVRVLRLESSLLLSMPTSDLLLALERITGANEITVRQVTNAVEAVITAATYRVTGLADDIPGGGRTGPARYHAAMTGSRQLLSGPC